MVQVRDDRFDRFLVEIELANHRDRAQAEAGDIADADVRQIRIRGVVDSGATRLVIPQAVADRLSLETTGQARVRYADGRSAERARHAFTSLTVTAGASFTRSSSRTAIRP